MTYSEASAVVKEHTGKELLESLEQLSENFHLEPARVRVAYHTLMAGFTELFHGVDE